MVIFTNIYALFHGARSSSVVERSLVVRWVVGSIFHGGPIELFLVTVSVQRPWYMLSCLWDDAFKRTLAANQKE